MKQLWLLAAAILLVAGTAVAHGPDRGKHGGPQVDAGDYHVEMVAKDTTLSIYVSNDKDQPVDAKGFKATGLFVVGGKAQRIELKHEIENKLSGSSPVALPTKLKGAVQIMLPGGKTVQAKFE
ncbi:MAG: hypothetical protein AB7O44_25900 [Hyphomicrobiaceae bacterium]|jgi:hypothetical protein